MIPTHNFDLIKAKQNETKKKKIKVPEENCRILKISYGIDNKRHPRHIIFKSECFISNNRLFECPRNKKKNKITYKIKIVKLYSVSNGVILNNQLNQNQKNNLEKINENKQNVMCFVKWACKIYGSLKKKFSIIGIHKKRSE